MKRICLVLSLALLATSVSAQPPAGRGGRGPMNVPKKGVCPLPVLPALPGDKEAEFYATANVPHGKVEVAAYKNYAGADKTMRVYLPPDYDAAADARYPVLYLNHGGGDNDKAWTITDPAHGGFANFVLDNLIAAHKAKKMIVVMPDTGKCASRVPSAPGKDDACTQEYLKDIIPYIDGHYRTKASREGRAIAGLSMGGFVVLHTGLPHLDTFSEIYVYSSGHISEEDFKTFEENYTPLLKDPKTNDLFRIPLYMAAGETDIALFNSERVLSLFNRTGIRTFSVLSTGGHEWMNWRRYLWQTAQILFPDCEAR